MITDAWLKALFSFACFKFGSHTTFTGVRKINMSRNLESHFFSPVQPIRTITMADNTAAAPAEEVKLYKDEVTGEMISKT